MHDQETTDNVNSDTKHRTVIANATIAAEFGVFEGHIVLEGGKIAALVARGAIPPAGEIIDAKGLVCFPGGVDPHVHFEDPGHTEREDFSSGTMAAAAGGVTTLFEHPLSYPPTTTADLYRQKREMAKEKVIVDFGLWGALTGPALGEIRGQWEEGAYGFKAFMPFSEPDYPNVDDAELVEGMRIVESFDGLVLVHAENDALLQTGLRRMRELGRRDPLAHHESRPAAVEEEAVQRALFLAGQTGVRIQVVHVSSPRSAEFVRQARLGGCRASMEMCPHHLLLDLDDLVRLGPYGRCAPALRERELVERLWTYVLQGRGASLVSDHCPYTIQEKDLGKDDIFAAPNGVQVIQEMLPLVLHEAHYHRGMTLDAFARFSATNAARHIGLYPRKGSLLPGADADLTLWDLNSQWIVESASQQFSKNPWSPFEGRLCRVQLKRTIVRGHTVYADGEILTAAGFGRFLSSQDRC
jgi:allantoinase